MQTVYSLDKTKGLDIILHTRVVIQLYGVNCKLFTFFIW